MAAVQQHAVGIHKTKAWTEFHGAKHGKKFKGFLCESSANEVIHGNGDHAPCSPKAPAGHAGKECLRPDVGGHLRDHHGASKVLRKQTSTPAKGIGQVRALVWGGPAGRPDDSAAKAPALADDADHAGLPTKGIDNSAWALKAGFMCESENGRQQCQRAAAPLDGPVAGVPTLSRSYNLNRNGQQHLYGDQRRPIDEPKNAVGVLGEKAHPTHKEAAHAKFMDEHTESAGEMRLLRRVFERQHKDPRDPKHGHPAARAPGAAAPKGKGDQAADAASTASTSAATARSARSARSQPSIRSARSQPSIRSRGSAGGASAR